MSGYSGTAAFYSPGPENTHQRVADMVVCSELKKTEQWGKLQDRWLCMLLGMDPMVIKKVDSDGPWLFALGHVASTCGIGWRALKTDGAFAGTVFWEFAEGIDNMDYIVVTDEEAWHGYNMEFLLPSVQLRWQA